MALVVGLALTACTSVGTGSDAVRGAVGLAGTRGEASAILGSNDAGSADTSEARALAGTNRDAGSPSRGAPDAGNAVGSSDPREGNERETEDSGVAGSSAGGGAGGATGGSLGSEHDGGASGSGGTGGTNQEGGTAGSASSSPAPACSFDLDHGGPGTRCVGLLFERCAVVDGVAVYQSTRCGVSPDAGMNCDEAGGCYGECTSGIVSCSGNTVQTCDGGQWVAGDECAFQCVNGACRGACTPGDMACEGNSVVTCGQDYHYGNPVACPTDPNGITSCTGAGQCHLDQIPCAPGTADCSGDWACETNTSGDVNNCGGCGIVCPGAANATSTCGGSCSFTCNPGFADCDADPSNGCEAVPGSDPNNCGGCGIVCPFSGSCTAGACQYQVVSDFTSNTLTYGWVVDMVVDPAPDGDVYWWTSDSSGNSILRAPKSGGTPQVLTTFVDAAVAPRDNALLLDSGNLYWARSVGVFRMAAAGGAVTQISSYGAASLAIAGNELYWNDSSIGGAPTCQNHNYTSYQGFLNCNAYAVVTFFTLDLGTLAQTQWQTTQYEYSNVLGVQGDELFVAEYHAVDLPYNSTYHYFTRLVTLDVATGAFSRIIAADVRVADSSQDLGDLFGQLVITGSSVVFQTELGLYQTSGAPAGEAAFVIPGTGATYASFNATPEYLAADDSYVYLPLTLDSVRRISRSTGAVQNIFGSTGNTSSKLALDAGYVYWNLDLNGQRAIVRAAK